MLRAENTLGQSLQAAEAAVRAGVQSGGGAALPGMIFNQSKKVTYTDALTGRERSVHAGRMECTMQVCMCLFERLGYLAMTPAKA